MANEYMKKYSMSLAIKEMQNKTALRFHLKIHKMVIIRKQTTNSSMDAEVRTSLTQLLGEM
jgi:hypothetical protein